MKRENLLLLSVLLAVGLACNKDQDQGAPDQSVPVNNLGELSVSSTFNWSSSSKGQLNIQMEAPGYLSTEGQWLELRDSEGAIVAREKIENKMASFHIAMPQYEGKLFAYYPYTQESLEINRAGNHIFKLKVYDLEGDMKKLNKSSLGSAGSSASSGTNLLTNGDFSQGFTGDDLRGSGALRTIGQWYRQNTHATVATVNGEDVFTSSSTAQARIMQALAVQPQYIYDLNYTFAGNGSVLVYFFNANEKLVGYYWPTTNGNNGIAQIEVPANVEYIQLMARADNSGWVDDMSVTQLNEPDTDGDGVIDRLDDYPNDASKAYASYYPLVGRQTLAFEDLWPNLGDFDFNDLVLSNLFEFGSDANGELVDLKVKVQINAMGAGVASGVGMALHSPGGQQLPQGIIASISGDAQLDPQVSNGVIVFNNVRDALSKPYMNNGQGPDGDPEEFEFTISFNQQALQSPIEPEIYIFRADDRGREVHLPGYAPTAAADPSYFNTKDDNGNYRSHNGLPWAIEIIYPGTLFFKHPLEKVDIVKAYPNFQEWAVSSGTRQTGWMIHPADGKVYNFQ